MKIIQIFQKSITLMDDVYIIHFAYYFLSLYQVRFFNQILLWMAQY